MPNLNWLYENVLKRLIYIVWGLVVLGYIVVKSFGYSSVEWDFYKFGAAITPVVVFLATYIDALLDIGGHGSGSR